MWQNKAQQATIPSVEHCSSCYFLFPISRIQKARILLRAFVLVLSIFRCYFSTYRGCLAVQQVQAVQGCFVMCQIVEKTQLTHITKHLSQSLLSTYQYISPGLGAAAGAGGSGMSQTILSVVSKVPATLAAFCNAERVTFVGSKMPFSIMSP